MPRESRRVENANPIRIMIVHPEPVVQVGLDALISRQPGLATCGQAVDCAEALRLAEATGPDLIIVSIALRDGCGLRLIKRIKARDASVRFLVLSGHDEALFAVRALRAGAFGFVAMNQSTETIIAAIRRVCAGKLYLGEQMTQRLLQGLAAAPATEPAPVQTLTNRELQVFDLLRQGCATREIAAHLNVSFKTVEGYRGAIRRKLKIARGGKLAQFAMQWD
jgi:DNA-binding NarL/FixJ family response regulator